jgi:hypothetical protein
LPAYSTSFSATRLLVVVPPVESRNHLNTTAHLINKTQMKYLNQLLTVLLAASVLTACKKDEVEASPLTSITLVNAVYGGASVKLGSNATTIANNNYAQMAIIAGENNLYIWPVGDSLHPYYTNPKFVSKDREVYSLFLTGNAASPSSILIKEDIPYRIDSTAGIRFINLLGDSITVKITRNKTPTVVEVDNLAYRQNTGYLSYTAKYNSTDTFQVRNAATNALLTQQAFTAATYPRFANVTLVIRKQGSAYGILRVNNDR